MSVRTLFATRFYEGLLADPDLLAELESSVRILARDDKAGQRWAKDNRYPGYTSYASLDDLPVRDPAFADLRRHLDAHVKRFAALAFLDLAGRKLKLDSLWVNILKPGGGHAGHIHPNSIISGTLYVAVPPGSAPLKLEDPRLPMMMAAPPRTPDAPEDAQTFVYAQPEPGTLYLWESWLRHEVPAGHAPAAAGSAKTKAADRISISFNYR